MTAPVAKAVSVARVVGGSDGTAPADQDSAGKPKLPMRPQSSPSTWAGIWVLGSLGFLIISRRSLRKLL